MPNAYHNNAKDRRVLFLTGIWILGLLLFFLFFPLITSGPFIFDDFVLEDKKKKHFMLDKFTFRLKFPKGASRPNLPEVVVLTSFWSIERKRDKYHSLRNGLEHGASLLMILFVFSPFSCSLSLLLTGWNGSQSHLQGSGCESREWTANGRLWEVGQWCR